MCRRILAAEPDHPDALHLGGCLTFQLGDGDQAIGLLQAAVALMPGNADAHFNLGAVLKRSGRIEDAEGVYRRVVERHPDNTRANRELGTALHMLGRLEEALDAYRRVLAIAPDDGAAHHNLAIALKDLGRADEALASCRRATELQPDHAETHANLGSVLHTLGDLDEAERTYRRALEIVPEYADAHSNLGAVLHDLGRLDEAVAAHRRVLAIDPARALAHHNLGAALKDQGKLDEAIDCYVRALDIDPGLAVSYYSLGTALREQGEVEESIARHRRAARLAPEELRFWQGFADSLRGVAFLEADESFREDLLRCLAIEGIDHQRAARTAAAALVGSTAFRLSAAPGAPAEVLGDPLLHGLLERVVICDPRIEELLTAARRALLEAALAAPPAAKDGEERLSFLCSLAHQCFTNDYVYFVTEGEVPRVETLTDDVESALDNGTMAPLESIALLAAYRPLHRLRAMETLREFARSRPSHPLSAVIDRQVAQPLEEMALRDEIARVGKIEDEVSKAVRAQYEESPYPRWLSLRHEEVRPLAGDVLTRFPFLEAADVGALRAPDILVAGCGTGRDALVLARRHVGARVLAFDLSLTSLAYGRRRAGELGISNVEFAQGDMLEMADLDRRFDLVSCTGVLHHLGDPAEGWRVLVGLIKPGGYMWLGLYSEIARRHVTKARAYAAERCYEATTDGIRRCRRDLMSLPDDSPLKEVVASKDFYATSSCRDLLFHVKEHRFTLPQIAGLLDALDLEFLGFETERAVLREYRDRFPEDPAARSLHLWHRYEEAHPAPFAGMYEFWVRKR